MLTIVFDLDGTLIDTAPDLIDTLNVILAREGLPAVAYDDARAMIGGGARAMIERALKAERRDEAKAELDRMFSAFIEHYAAHIADRSRPFPHLEATLDGLAGAGHRLAVCTNKLEWLSVRLQFGDRHLAIAEVDGDHGDGGSARGAHIGAGIADHNGAIRRAAGTRNGLP